MKYWLLNTLRTLYLVIQIQVMQLPGPILPLLKALVTHPYWQPLHACRLSVPWKVKAQTLAAFGSKQNPVKDGDEGKVKKRGTLYNGGVDTDPTPRGMARNPLR
jgi:hypothetical protein